MISIFKSFRLGMILALCLFGTTLQAQDAEPFQRFSVNVNAPFDGLGGLAEYFLKPNVSAWASFGYYAVDTRLGFGEDSTTGNFFNPPLEEIFYNNLQQSVSVRTGVRFYGRTRKEKWVVWYSPVLGYRNLSAPSESYKQDYRRSDLHRHSEIKGLREAKRTLELGGEIGTRWAFWRSFHLEGGVLLLGKRSLLKSDKSFERAQIQLRAGLGIKF